MFFAIAALLIHPQIAPQPSFSADKIELLEPANSAISSKSAVSDNSLPAVLAVADTADTAAQPVAESSAAGLPDAPTPASAVEATGPMALIAVKPSKRMTVSVSELRAEDRRNQILWKGLVIASSSAATFDAWSTRRALTMTGAQELDPVLKPFAGNASLYAAIQVGPALMDYAGRKMTYSHHSLVRHMWWVPQTLSFASSLFCGAHNLSYH